ncbi:MAG: hypothetical protein NTW97_00510 [Candidatus Krumholzibacteria bacterium]|nr:hypothetical protein [Candidatus Krumholzibacteria bacterium]
MEHLLDGGSEVRALLRVYAAALVISMIASIGATAEPSRINKSIYGFYLGESKPSLIQRARQEGIAYSQKGKLPDQLFPDSYLFKGSLDKSKLVEYVIVSFYRDYVGQVDIHLTDNSDRQFMQAAQVLDQSWNSFPGYSGQSFGPMYIITVPEVLITLVKAKTGTHIAYVHRGLMRTHNEERSKALARE